MDWCKMEETQKCYVLFVLFTCIVAAVDGGLCPDGETWSAVFHKCIHCDLCKDFPGDLACENCSSEMLAEQKLYKRLFHDYNKKVRPVWNASHPINVSLSISITQLMDLDERNQALTTNVWIAQHWKDEKLRWNANEFDDIQVLRIPAVDIWFPDITLYNTADENGFSVNLESNALVYSNGQVSHWSKPTLLKSTCKIIVRYFPFDYQQCRMKFGSWTYNSFQVNLQNDSIAPDMSTFMPNEQWDIVYAVTRPHVVRYDCCPESYPDVTFVIGLKRKPLYYVYNVVLPCVLLTALSLVGFNMPFNIGVVKVSLGVMLLLSLGVFNLQVSQTMPKTSEEISLLGEYFAATMVLISLSVAMNVAVLNINEWGKNGTYDVPGWIRVFVMQYMAMFMCVKQCYSVNTLAIDGDKNNERNGKGKKGGGNLSSGNIESGTGTFENGSPCLSHSTTFYAQPDTADNSVLPIDPSYRRGQVWLPRDNDGSQDNYKNKKNLVVHHEGLRGLENSCRNTLSAPMIALTEIPPPPSPPPPPNAQINPQFTSVPCAPPKRRLCDCKQETKLSKFTYTSHPPPRLERHVEQIAELIKRPQQFSERRRQIEYDWMVVATTVDRFLLALFLICSVIFTITFLAQRPGNMEPPEEAYAIDYEY